MCSHYTQVWRKDDFGAGFPKISSLIPRASKIISVSRPKGSAMYSIVENARVLNMASARKTLLTRAAKMFII